MADFDLTIFKTAEEALARLKEMASEGTEWKILERNIEEVGKRFKLSGDAIGGFKKEIVNVIDGMKQFINYSKNLNEAGSYFESLRKRGADALNDLKSKIGDTNMSMGGFAVKAVALSPPFIRLSEVPRQFLDIGKAAEGTQTQLTALIDKNPAVMAAIKKTLGSLGYTGATEDIRKYAAMADATRNMQRGMLMAAAASGNLSEMMQKLGKDLPAGLDKASEAYNQMTTSIANATGLSSEQAAVYVDKAMLIPGMLKNISESTTIAGSRMHFMSAAIQVAAGTGQDISAVLGDLGFAFEELNIKGEKSLEFIQRMQSVSDATGLPLEKMRTFVKDASLEMAMLGENTDGVIDIMGRVGPALLKTGASTSQTTKIVKDMIDGLNGMSTATKAFISGSTGGPGGLMGAFRIDEMLEKGQSAEVFQKIRDNMLTRLGGPIVTREQAARDSTAAAQYQKQLMFMMSPAMGGMAKDERSAARLLKALSEGDTGKLAEGLGASTAEAKEDALRKTIQQGHEIQKSGNNLLAMIANNTAEAGGVISIATNKAITETMGAKSTVFGGPGGADDRAKRADAAQYRTNPLIGRGLFGGKDPNVYFEDIAKSVTHPLDMIRNLGRGERFGAKPLVTGDEFSAPEPGFGPMFSPGPIPTPGERAERTLALATAEGPTTGTPLGGPARPMAQPKVDVAVTTVCSECHRKISAEEANKAIAHHHDQQVKQNYLGTP